MRRVGFSFLLSVIIHFIAIFIMAFFAITTSEKLPDYIQVEWLKMPHSKPKRAQIIMKRRTSPIRRISDTLPRFADYEVGYNQKIPPVWTAVSLELNHQEENLCLPPILSVLSPLIPPSREGIGKTNKTPMSIKSLKTSSLSHIEPKNEGLLKLLPMLESTMLTAEPVLQDTLSPYPRDSLSSYLEEVRAKIESVKKYPVTASKFGIEGIVHVKFTILPDGSVKGIEVGHSSGYETLDRAAISAIENAAPFPPFRETIERRFLRIEVPLVFKLLDQVSNSTNSRT